MRLSPQRSFEQLEEQKRAIEKEHYVTRQLAPDPDYRGGLRRWDTRSFCLGHSESKTVSSQVVSDLDAKKMVVWLDVIGKRMR